MAHPDSFRDEELFYRRCTITTANPAVVTRRYHALEAGERVQFYSTDTLPTGLSTDTWYFVIATGITNDDFRVAATKGGSAIQTTVAGSGTYYFSPEQSSRVLPSQESTL